MCFHYVKGKCRYTCEIALGYLNYILQLHFDFPYTATSSYQTLAKLMGKKLYCLLVFVGVSFLLFVPQR